VLYFLVYVFVSVVLVIYLMEFVADFY